MDNYQRQFVLNLLAYAAQRDLSLPRLCNLADIDLASLKSKPSARITSKQLNDLWLNASHLSKDPLFGLHFGESLQLAALGIVGEIIQNSRTVGEALTQAAQLAHLLTDLFAMEVAQSSDIFTIRFVPFKEKQQNYAFAFSQTLDLFMVFVLHELDGLVLKKIKPVSVTLPRKKLTDPQEYERVLRCTSVNTGDTCSMKFEKRYWDEPILTANYELQGLLLKKVNETHDALNAHSLKERITNFLLANSYLGIPSVEDVASNLNTSVRSLQRGLSDEGVTYRELADSVRKSLAMHYLESGNYQVKEISYMIGYNEISAFSRAFKRWTGATPTEYQQEH